MEPTCGDSWALGLPCILGTASPDVGGAPVLTQPFLPPQGADGSDWESAVWNRKRDRHALLVVGRGLCGQGHALCRVVTWLCLQTSLPIPSSVPLFPFLFLAAALPGRGSHSFPLWLHLAPDASLVLPTPLTASVARPCVLASLQVKWSPASDQCGRREIVLGQAEDWLSG